MIAMWRARGKHMLEACDFRSWDTGVTLSTHLLRATYQTPHPDVAQGGLHPRGELPAKSVNDVAGKDCIHRNRRGGRVCLPVTYDSPLRTV